MKIAIIFFAVFCLFGCATSPVRVADSRLVPHEQILSVPPRSATSLDDVKGDVVHLIQKLLDRNSEVE